jgi:O-antigen/teichoic acid export membrane protein
MPLAKNILTGTGWAGTSAYINAAISFVGNIFLARVLAPDDFGVYALAASFLSLIFMVSGFGTQESIVHCHDDTLDELIPTAFWMTISLGFVLALTGNIFALILLPHYGERISQLLLLLPWLSFIGMISNAYGAILQRQLIYKPIAITQTLSTSISYGVAVLAAYQNYGIWSLFIREALFTLLLVMGFGFTIGFHIPRRFNMRTAAWIWKFGWKVMGNRIEEILFERVDKLIIGTFLGTTILGQYNVAYRLAWVGHQFSYGAIESISFSVFSNVQKQLDKLRMAFEKMYYWLFRFSLILGLFVWFCGADLIVFIYGTKWSQAGYTFQNMAFLLTLLPLETSLRSFLVGAGYINYSLKIRFWQLIFFIPSIFMAAYWGGILWVVWSINISMCLSWLFAIRLTSRVIPVQWDYLMHKPIIAGFITYICIAIIDKLNFLTVNNFWGVMMRCGLLGIASILLMYFLDRHSLQNEWLLIRARLVSEQ